MTIVVFRKENERLASVCMKKFKTPIAAKKHIEEDAAFFISKHAGSIDWGWIKPDSLDYHVIELKSGVKCFWQYFEI